MTSKSDGLIRVDSECSIGFGDPIAEKGQETINNSPNNLFSNDIFSVLIICEKHQAILLQNVVDNLFYFPCLHFENNANLEGCDGQSWTKLIDDHLQTLITLDESQKYRIRLIDHYRAKLPKTKTFVNRYIFKVVLTPEKTCICSNIKLVDSLDGEATAGNKTTLWLSAKTFEYSMQYIWGGEVSRCFIDLHNIEHNKNMPESFCLKEVGWDYAQMLLEREDIKQCYRDISDITSIATYLQQEFILHCLPSDSMSLGSFLLLCNKICWNIPIETKVRFFRAFDQLNRNYLSFQDLLIGFILFDSNNQASSLDYRQGHIFRYYDQDMDNQLSKKEWRNLLDDYYLVYNEQLNEMLNVTKQTREVFIDQLIESTWSAKLDFDVYKETFKNQISKTIECHRSWLPTMNFFEMINFKFSYPSLDTIFPCLHNYLCCKQCQSRSMEISPYHLKITRDGQMGSIKLFEKSARNKSNLSFGDEYRDTNSVALLANEFINRIDKIGSVLEQQTEDSEDILVQNFFFESREKLLDLLKTLLTELESMLTTSDMIPNMSSPCYIVSGFHGSLKDLLGFTGRFYPMFPFGFSSSCVFLGDFINLHHGHNLECLVYLFSMKILSPSKICLLRDSSQETLSASRLMQLFGRGGGVGKDEANQLYQSVCTLIVNILQRLPLAGLIEHSILATHACFPSSIISLFRLENIFAAEETKTGNTKLRELKITLEKEFTHERKFEPQELQSFLDANRLFCLVCSEFNGRESRKLKLCIDAETIGTSSRNGCVFVDRDSLRLIMLHL